MEDEDCDFETVIVYNSVFSEYNTFGLDTGAHHPKQTYLDRFLLFPKLPVELRLMIWKLALPNGTRDDGERFFSLRAHHFHHVKPDRHMKIIFSTGEKDICRRAVNYAGHRDAEMLVEEAVNDEMDMRNVTLLKVSRESRGVFLKNFPNSLSTKWGGKAYFNDNTTLHLTNFDFELNRILARAVERGYKLPDFSQIRTLAIRQQIIAPAYEDIQILFMFSGLTTFTFHSAVASKIPHPGPDEGDDRAEYEKEIKEDFKRMKARLVVHKTEVNPAFRIPKFMWLP
ncbi:hypothetical protein G7Y89_g1130 [Cudoniella acicularis]|uniref:2EXR domain-containing protein n=1 Tax=Cudoniella acicularis TaxID=354080 RepID=A0A8H4RXW3_9HELO|nr:hypothetical protein G7Y89_g1130 [Cudoniella acicularis]